MSVSDVPLVEVFPSVAQSVDEKRHLYWHPELFELYRLAFKAADRALPLSLRDPLELGSHCSDEVECVGDRDEASFERTLQWFEAVLNVRVDLIALHELQLTRTGALA